MKFKLAFAGFGVVARGLGELLLEKKDELASKYGFEHSVVAVSDKLRGSVMDPEGLDLAALIKVAEEKGKQVRSNTVSVTTNLSLVHFGGVNWWKRM